MFTVSALPFDSGCILMCVRETLSVSLPPKPLKLVVYLYASFRLLLSASRAVLRPLSPCLPPSHHVVVCGEWGAHAPLSSFTSFPVSVFQCGVCPSICWCGVCWARVLVCMPRRIYVDLFACLCDFFLSFFNHGKNIYITKFAVLPILSVRFSGTLHSHCCTTTCGCFLCVSVVHCNCVCAYLGLVVSVYLSVFECEGLCFCLWGSVHRRVFHLDLSMPVVYVSIGCVRTCLCLSLTVWVYVWGSCVPMRGLLQCVSVSLCLCARIHVRLCLCLMLGPCQPMSALVLSMSLCVSVSCGSVCLYVCLNVCVQDRLCLCLSMTGSLIWRGDFCV